LENVSTDVYGQEYKTVPASLQSLSLPLELLHYCLCIAPKNRICSLFLLDTDNGATTDDSLVIAMYSLRCQAGLLPLFSGKIHDWFLSWISPSIT